jgi:hypothetical protein
MFDYGTLAPRIPAMTTEFKLLELTCHYKPFELGPNGSVGS